MPTYTNHKKAHWYDAARQLRSAARWIERAADEFEDGSGNPFTTLQKVDTLIEAAVVRLKDR